jgi:hypothetical protein
VTVSELGRLKRRFQAVLQEEGLGNTAAKAADKLLVYVSYPLQRRRLKNRQFAFWGKNFTYFCHHYNATWRNERSVEIALAKAKLAEYAGRRILEVGNVMSYYGDSRHTVIDKYEEVSGVQNVDIVDYAPEMRFDLILSISTLEHVGWDESPRDGRKFLVALERMRSLLAGGELFATVPLGHNPNLDEALSKKEVPASRVGYLKRLSRSDWREATSEEVAGTRYNYPYPGANAIAVITLSNS